MDASTTSATRAADEQLRRTGHESLLYYMLQQIEQFRERGEGFAMQHADTEYLGPVQEELQAAVLEAIPIEKRLRGLLPEERLRGLPPEERLRGLSPEERVRGLSPEERVRGLSAEELAGSLSEEQAARLRELLERR